MLNGYSDILGFGDEISELKHHAKVISFYDYIHMIILEWGRNKEVYDEWGHGGIKAISASAQEGISNAENISNHYLLSSFIDY
jgi:hypothetical protein